MYDKEPRHSHASSRACGCTSVFFVAKEYTLANMRLAPKSIPDKGGPISGHAPTLPQLTTARSVHDDHRSYRVTAQIGKHDQFRLHTFGHQKPAHCVCAEFCVLHVVLLRKQHLSTQLDTPQHPTTPRKPQAHQHGLAL